MVRSRGLSSGDARGVFRQCTARQHPTTASAPPNDCISHPTHLLLCAAASLALLGAAASAWLGLGGAVIEGVVVAAACIAGQ